MGQHHDDVRRLAPAAGVGLSRGRVPLLAALELRNASPQPAIQPTALVVPSAHHIDTRRRLCQPSRLVTRNTATVPVQVPQRDTRDGGGLWQRQRSGKKQPTQLQTRSSCSHACSHVARQPAS
eukprot:366365-Chlamydomonas_euryale.AAC.5